MHSLGLLERAVLGHRITVVEALPGYGKTHLVQQLERLRGCVAVPADHLVEDPAELARALASPGVERVLLDDVHLLAADGAAITAVLSLAARAARSAAAAGTPGLVLLGAPALPGPLASLALGDQVLQVGEPELTWQEAQIETYLLRAVGLDAAALAPRLQVLSGGWPALVVAAAGQLARRAAVDLESRAAALEDCFGAGGAATRYLVERVLGDVKDTDRELLRLAAHLDPAAAEVLAATVGGAGEGSARVRQLATRRLISLEQDVALLGRPLLAAIRVTWPMTPDDVRERMRRAAPLLHAAGRVPAAVLALRLSGDEAALSGALTESGQAMLRSGHDRVVVEGVRAIAPARRTMALTMLLGEALQVRGDWEGALRCYDSVADGDDPVPAGLAWRMGVIHYLRGRPREAERCYRRGRLVDEDTCDEAQLLGWMASAAWMTGESERCANLAQRAHGAAARCADPAALASAHVALALHASMVGDRSANDAHYTRALDYAEQAGDVLQVVRVRANRASHHLEEGSCGRALAELQPALAAAASAGFTAFEGLCHANEGEALLRLGRLDEAVAAYEASRLAYQSMGSAKVSYPLVGAGDVHRLSGRPELAAAAYEQALAANEGCDDQQALLPALGGLARVLRVSNPSRARQLAERALSLANGPYRGMAAITLGWVLCDHDPIRAAQLGADAAADCAQRRDWPAHAEALELQAGACAPVDPVRAASLLGKALESWQQTGDQIGGCRVQVALGRLGVDPDSSRQEQAARAQAELARRGIATCGAGLDGLLGVVGFAGTPRFRISTLGRFLVERDGEPIDGSAWQSRKARELLKILVSASGRPVPRERLIDLLWPDEQGERLANRLAVAAATLRRVLDPDRAQPGPGVVIGGDDTLALDLRNVQVDVLGFLSDARVGLGLLREGRSEAARQCLSAAVAGYPGDYLPENLYDDWAGALREQARDVLLLSLRGLTEAAEQRQDVDDVLRFARRAIESDPYEAWAHQAVVRACAAAGRRGAAARAHEQYRRRMAELEPEQTPGLRALAQ
ncbi:BTAD domain-containing putative transcriptional regulator [Angustibacter sp. McL0619]|uniref:BTAD domain-containing putative transcriptional regulator n=1 Tax=Angustibacter sp. McL0619 TaxID=3415676 RepID=UPI003CEB1B81